jgi:uncharacterized protein
MSVADSFNCLTCGACCATYRVSFYAGECDYQAEGLVPTELVTPITPFMVCMQGTEKNPSRCVALQGTIGESIHCSIYANRSSTCRNFAAGSEACISARIKHGLVHQFEVIPATVIV